MPTKGNRKVWTEETRRQPKIKVKIRKKESGDEGDTRETPNVTWSMHPIAPCLLLHQIQLLTSSPLVLSNSKVLTVR